MDGFCNRAGRQRLSARLPRRTIFSRCKCRCSRMRVRLPLHILLLHTQVSRWAHTYRGYASFSDICGFGSGFGIGFTLLLARSFTLSSSSCHPPFTQYPVPSRSLVCDGQTSPHMPRFVVPHSTCPSLFPFPPRTQLYNRSCSNKHNMGLVRVCHWQPEWVWV
jgi:hypothetical protein